MTTLTLKDGVPTTTITFNSLTSIDWRMDAKSFHPYALPDNKGAIIVHEGMWLEFLKMSYQLLDDATYPSSGDSCTDKWLVFRDFVKSGGDSDYLYNLTFDHEESRPGSSSTITLVGKVKNMTKRFIAGKNTVHIEGDFEFWLGKK